MPAMNPNKALWEKGDFTRIAASMRESGEALVASLGVAPGMKVLDLGCGDGTTALPAARQGADVLGVDIASNLVEAGNRRAKAAGVTNLRFQESSGGAPGALRASEQEHVQRDDVYSSDVSSGDGQSLSGLAMLGRASRSSAPAPYPDSRCHLASKIITSQ
jgi:SAM-dependent methyltransferase